MLDRHLNPHVTGRTERHEVGGLVHDVHDQIAPPWRNMVNMERAAARAAVGSAQTTNPVALDDLGANLLPARAVHQTSPAAVVRMAIARKVLVRAIGRAEPPATLNLVRKEAMRFAAMFARLDDGRYKALVPTFPGAVVDRLIGCAERLAALQAINDTRRSLPECLVARGRTEMMNDVRSYNVFWPRKLILAMRAFICGSPLHRARVAGFAAEYSGSEVSLELNTALGT